jgi:hypothetical protein
MEFGWDITFERVGHSEEFGAGNWHEIGCEVKVLRACYGVCSWSVDMGLSLKTSRYLGVVFTLLNDYHSDEKN